MRSVRCLKSVTVLFVVATAASGQPLYELGLPPLDLAARIGPHGEPGRDAFPVQVHVDRLREPWIEFPTPDGGNVVAQMTALEERRDGFTWRGRVIGGAFDSITVTREGGYVVATFGEPGGPKWSLRARPNGSGRLTAAKPTSKPARVAHENHFTPPEAPREPGAAWAEAQTVESSSSTSTHRIDILALYDEWSLDEWKWYQSSSAAAEIQAMLDYANTVFANGQIPATVSLVYHELMPQSVYDAGSAGQAADNSWLKAVGTHKDAQALRAKWGADIVVLFINDWWWDVCGEAVSRLKGTTNKEMSTYGYISVNLSCAAFSDPTAVTFTHELGHIFGGQHEPASVQLAHIDSTTTVRPYAFGHTDTANGVWTIMSYGAELSGWSAGFGVVPYFSTVRVSPNGWTLGIANKRENERVVRLTARGTSRFSQFLPKPVPAAPDLQGEASTIRGRVLLRWTDNSDDETHFTVRYRRANRKWQQETVRANGTKWLKDDLASGKIYTFQVNAVNTHGSTGSNKVRVKVR